MKNNDIIATSSS